LLNQSALSVRPSSWAQILSLTDNPAEVHSRITTVAAAAGARTAETLRRQLAEAEGAVPDLERDLIDHVQVLTQRVAASEAELAQKNTISKDASERPRLEIITLCNGRAVPTERIKALERPSPLPVAGTFEGQCV